MLIHINIILEGPSFPFFSKVATGYQEFLWNNFKHHLSSGSYNNIEYTRIANFKVRELRMFREDTMEM